MFDPHLYFSHCIKKHFILEWFQFFVNIGLLYDDEVFMLKCYTLKHKSVKAREVVVHRHKQVSMLITQDSMLVT